MSSKSEEKYFNNFQGAAMEILHTDQPSENLLNSRPGPEIHRREGSADKNSELLNKHSSNNDSENKLSSSGPLQHWKEFWMIVQSDCLLRLRRWARSCCSYSKAIVGESQ